MTNPDEKTCQRCGETFRRTKGRARSEFERRKYCSETCSLRGIPRPGQPKRQRCRKDLHDLDEANTRIDNRGNRSCKACAAKTDRKRKGRKPKAPPLVPSTGDAIPRVVPAAERPVWRPPGWSSQPRIGGS